MFDHLNELIAGADTEKRMTDRDKVLAKYPNAKCVPISYGRGKVAVVIPKGTGDWRLKQISGSFDTEAEAWAAAASRLGNAAEPAQNELEPCAMCGKAWTPSPDFPGSVFHICPHLGG